VESARVLEQYLGGLCASTPQSDVLMRSYLVLLRLRVGVLGDIA